VSEEDRAFWKTVQAGAANLNLQVVMGEGGIKCIRHLKAKGEDGRATDEQVETFHDFLFRHRETICRANGVEASPVAQDARRFKEWLERHRDAPECVLDGRMDFHRERKRLLDNYREDGAWVLSAYLFRQAVSKAQSWELSCTK